MQIDNKDLTNVEFDSDWRCYCQHSNDRTDEQSMLLAANDLEENDRWPSIHLPHITGITGKHKHHEIGLYQWWYAKQFSWMSNDQRLEQRVYLMFELIDERYNSFSTSQLTGTVWLNNTQIYSGSFMPLSNLIELPSHLLRNENSAEKRRYNILTIRCLNSSLSLHTRLTFCGSVICATGKLDMSENIDNKPINTNEKENDVLNYTVSVDDNVGRIDVVFNSKKKYRAPTKPSPPLVHSMIAVNEEKLKESNEEPMTDLLVPRLAIVILIVGTRGDVQPFIALGQALRASGHRVRLATHEVFRSFVRGNGLEFYPLAGDPADLISFMVKNAGIIPSVSSIVAGDVAKKRRSLSAILTSTWQACIADDDETDAPFRAEAIIANPPSFGHIHCAEKLQIPLHIMFTMPWSPTGVFAHPLANIASSTGPKEVINRYSYTVIEMLTWTGMRDIVNNFRQSLGLLTLNTSQAVCALVDERVPHTYCWSPALVSKPYDWESYIDVSGFFFLDLGTAFTNPPQDLLDFLGLTNDHGISKRLPPPIYIGFGSIAGHDSRRILAVVIEALTQTGYRAILSGLASDTDQLPSNILKIGNVPHDWLFQHVSAVCHHGGAGTTAAGLRAGKPTIIVPFFGDQFFWGTVVEKSGAGPHAIPGKSISAKQLATAFHFVHKPTTCEAAQRIAQLISKENGCVAAVHAFHRNLPLKQMHSDLEPTFPACYRLEKYKLQISRPVAQVLVVAGLIEESQLRQHVTREWKFMYDTHMHMISHGFFEHFRKAFSTMFIDTASDLKRSASTGSMSKRTLGSVGSVAKGVGLGIGHVSIGYLSLYGELTDVLDRVTYLYDPYSAQKQPQRPLVKDFKSGAIAAGLAAWNGCREGVTGIVKHPQAGYKRHGIAGGAAGSFIATVNIGVKPAVGILSSLTWLSRGAYASLRNIVQHYRNEGRHLSSTLIDVNAILSTENDKQTSSEQDENISSAAKRAANVSGYHPRICQYIMDEFGTLKTEYEQKMLARTKKQNPVAFFTRPFRSRQSPSPNRLSRQPE